MNVNNLKSHKKFTILASSIMKKFNRYKVRSRLLIGSSICTRHVLFSVVFLLVILFTVAILYFKETGIFTNPRILHSHSKNISTFLSRSQFKGNNLICGKDTEVLVGVISSPTKFEARKALRIAISQLLPPNWKLIFFLGELISKTIERSELLEKELEQEKDLIIVNIKDTYENLTLKVGLLFHWANTYCSEAKYFLKVDDDMYINIDKILRLIKCTGAEDREDESLNNNNCNFQERKTKLKMFREPNYGKTIYYMILGHVYNRLFPIRDPSSKWYLSEESYPNSTLPYFVSGTAYLITSNLIPYALDVAKTIPVIKLEDVYFTGLVMSDNMKLALTHMTDWSNFRPRWDDICYYKQLLTAHGLSPKEIIYFTLKSRSYSNETCDTWIRKFLIKVNQLVTHYVPRVT